MSIPAKVGESIPLIAQLGDGNETQYPQAEIYAAGGTVPLTTLDLGHKARGRYEQDWTPTTVGVFSAVYIVYSDAGHTTENTVYDRDAEQIFVSVSNTDDLASSILRLLGLHRENVFIDNTEFDGNDQLIACRVRLFNSKTNALAATDGDNYSTGLIATYTMDAEHEGLSTLKTFRQVRDS